MTGAPSTRGCVDWGWAGRALDVVSGDAHVFAEFSGGALVGLIDGLGHGPDAAAAAIAAVAVLEAHPDDAVESLVERCHEGLRKTRGVVLSLASFRLNDSAVTWVGVGNIEGVLIRFHRSSGARDEAITGRGGVVGYQLPPLRSMTLPVFAGDTLIFVTDGVRGSFTRSVVLEDSPQEIAETVLARHGARGDDAHVIVARYRGAP
jgi:hypothetical protein